MMKMKADFNSKYGPWALVAGASEGLGREFSLQLGEKGLNLALVARNQDKLNGLRDELQQKFNLKVMAIPGDLSDPGTPGNIIAQTKDLDIGFMVYNATFPLIGDFSGQQISDHLQLLEVNCAAPLKLIHHFGNLMIRKKRGGIILMSSLSALQGSAKIVHYAASKAYTKILGEGLWYEFKKDGVDVLSCCAGATSTPSYIDSKPAWKPFLSPPVLEAGQVVSRAFKAMGKHPSYIPGYWNRVAAAFMSKLLTRKSAVTIMGKNMEKMYAHYK